ncbi:MAG TPA: di-heme oxidoredictase family protein [Bauldia sp.]|nr:di-heme oxidoredictase family protein [Bauldia sp.]
MPRTEATSVRRPGGWRGKRLAVLALAALAAAAAVPGIRAAGDNPVRAALVAAPFSPNLGGDTTRVIATDKAFTYMAANSPGARERPFFFGNRIFNTNWVEYPASVKLFDGLGPLFNRNSCSGCHVRDGRGRPPETAGGPMDSMLVRLSAPDGKGPHPEYGDQLNDNAVLGVKPEGRALVDYTEAAGSYGDGTPYTLLVPHYRFAGLAYGPLDDAPFSPRVSPQVIGLGLLAAVPDATLEALADPDDADADGISGRINWLPDGKGGQAIGRFGWKANVATLREQAAGAAHGDIGLTSSLFPAKNCTPVEKDCVAAAADTGPDLGDSFLDRLVLYVETIAVPNARIDGPAAEHGLDLFRRFGCASCHVPTLKTAANAPFPELAGQTFHPFTDLLLHDMGEGLADRRPDGSATGSEWRTPPLWGLGLVPRVNGHDRLLHDGRARGFAEAILWHGGEGEAAKEAFRTADAADRKALIDFLEGL